MRRCRPSPNRIRASRAGSTCAWSRSTPTSSSPSGVECVFGCLPHGASMDAIRGRSLLGAGGCSASSISAPTIGCAIPTSTPSGTAKAITTSPTWRRRSTACPKSTATRSRPPSSSPTPAAIRRPASSAWRRWWPASTSTSRTSSSTARAASPGAGRTPKLTTHFPECNESVAAYSVGQHRHTPEIEQALTDVAGEPVEVIFTPHLIPMDRGIFTTIYATPHRAVHRRAAAGPVPRLLCERSVRARHQPDPGDQGQRPHELHRHDGARRARPHRGAGRRGQPGARRERRGGAELQPDVRARRRSR